MYTSPEREKVWQVQITERVNQNDSLLDSSSHGGDRNRMFRKQML